MSFGLRQSFGRLCKQEELQQDLKNEIARAVDEEDEEVLEECRQKILAAMTHRLSQLRHRLIQ